MEWISEPVRLGELEQPWQELALSDPYPFSTHHWFTAWWEAFGAGSRLSTCALWDADKLLAVLPLCERRGHIQALANDHSPVFRPLGRDPASVQALVEGIVSTARAPIVVPALPAEDPGLQSLIGSSRQTGRLTYVEQQHTSPVVDTAGDFSDYRGETKGRWGATLERFRRKAQREHDARFFLVESPADVDGELARFFDLEAAGWKGRAGTAITSSPATERFYRALAKSFHERGELRLSGVEFDGRLAAFDFSILHRNRLYLIKTGYDESLGRLAPGLVLRLGIIERCFELGIDAHELLGDADAWKLKFSTSERQHRLFRSYRRTPLQALRYGYRAGVRPLLKNTYRRLRPESEGRRGS